MDEFEKQVQALESVHPLISKSEEEHLLVFELLHSISANC